MTTIYKPIKKLSSQTAQKIAAGEVIERPAAVLRELLDNALDADADKIIVELNGGGSELIRVVDNGYGMTYEDLLICTEPHSTSKIQSADDLLKLSSLGFRGEALSSIAAVSRLSITSTRKGPQAWRHFSYNFSDFQTEPATLEEGTVVEVAGLFENFPARKKFLKRAGAERTVAKQVFVEKALAHPAVEMRFIADGKMQLALPPHASLKKRFIAALELTEPESLFFELPLTGEGFSGTIVIGSPDISRKDRRAIFIFANKRRIAEYGLVQAISYGAEGYFPNGLFPVAAVFLQITPELIDFNIHPAKKEARIKPLAAIHHALSTSVAKFFRHHGFAQQKQFYSAPGTPGEPDIQAQFFTAPPARSVPAFETSIQTQRMHTLYAAKTLAAEPAPQYRAGNFMYIGQALGTFLLAEKDESLYIIDQHAAHERIIFNELKNTAGASQELLVPYTLISDSPEQDKILQQELPALTKLGFRIEYAGEHEWHVFAVPERWVGTESDLQADLIDEKRIAQDLLHNVLAKAACRAAFKDGDVLDPSMAYLLVEKTFALPEPLCPHGRPLWIMLPRSELFELVKRT